jgi:hypothetical protein
MGGPREMTLPPDTRKEDREQRRCDLASYPEQSEAGDDKNDRDRHETHCGPHFAAMFLARDLTERGDIREANRARSTSLEFAKDS